MMTRKISSSADASASASAIVENSAPQPPSAKASPIIQPFNPPRPMNTVQKSTDTANLQESGWNFKKKNKKKNIPPYRKRSPPKETFVPQEPDFLPSIRQPKNSPFQLSAQPFLPSKPSQWPNSLESTRNLHPPNTSTRSTSSPSVETLLSHGRSSMDRGQLLKSQFEHFQPILPIRPNVHKNGVCPNYLYELPPSIRPAYLQPASSLNGTEVKSNGQVDFRSVAHMDANQFIQYLHPTLSESTKQVEIDEDDPISTLRENRHHRVLYCPPRFVPSPKLPPHNVFPAYLPISELEAGLLSGRFRCGLFRVRKTFPVEAYVTLLPTTAPLVKSIYEAELLAEENEEEDMMVFGQLSRNRAFDGDLVVLQKLDTERVEKKNEKFHAKRRGPSTPLPSVPKDEDSPSLFTSASSGTEDQEEEVSGTPTEARLYGQVVGILCSGPHRIGSNSVVGTLHALDQTQKWYSFRPRQKIYSHFRVHASDPKLPPHHPLAFVYTARSQPWLESHRFPIAVIDSCLGPFGSLNTEINALFVRIPRPPEFDFNSLEHWTIPEVERKTRVDRTNQCVFSIDPAEARDLDDALHIEYLDETNLLEVGVHIADVSYFVSPSSYLDKWAKQMCNSIYLLKEVVNMLPRKLCDDLCSLKPGAERLCFSVIWHMHLDGTIVKTQFERTIIRSRVKLTYEQAQSWLDGESGNLGDMEKVKESVLALYDLSKKLRFQRIENGFLSLGNKKLKFKLNQDGFPLSCERFLSLQSHHLNEEFMILANRCVAEKLFGEVPDFALLRRHAPPSNRSWLRLTEKLQAFGIQLTGEEANARQLASIFDQLDDPLLEKMVRFGTARYMQKARYVCSQGLPANLLNHFALAMPLYTHFTSPIRRYSDILVHRMLATLIDVNNGVFSAKEIKVDAYHCNVQKDLARTLEEDQQTIYMCAYLNEFPIPIICEAYVWGVRERSLELILLDFCLELNIEYRHFPHVQVDLIQPQVTVIWETEGEEKKEKVLRLLDPVSVQLRALWETSPPKIHAELLP